MDNAAIAAELVADIVSAGLERVVLVGHSQAGQVLPLMAALRPDLFRRMVYVGCSTPCPARRCWRSWVAGGRARSRTRSASPFDPGTVSADVASTLMFCTDITTADRAAFLGRPGADRWPAETYAYTDWTTAHPAAIDARYVLCLRDAILPRA